MINFKPVKGTRDFYPDEMLIRNWLFDIWRKASLQAGFEEYDSCVLEHEELYIRKSGEEISDQLYKFEDKNGRKLSLRPEMTPSLARMILQHKRAFSFPIRWFSIPQCFRYERMTKGRRREHFQWNADIIGDSNVVCEAELILLIIHACNLMGLSNKEVKIFINDRRIINDILNFVKVPKHIHKPLMIIMDKREKISDSIFQQLVLELGVSKKQFIQIKKFFEINDLKYLDNIFPGSRAINEIRELIDFISVTGFNDYCKFDLSVIRGLSYYTGLVFEINNPGKNYRSLCGGGRSDSLLSNYGGDTLPAIGFGFGDVVILDILKELNKSPSFVNKLDYTIVPFDIKDFQLALKIATKLRSFGLKVECNFTLKKLKKILQRISESGSAKAVLLLPSELSKNQIVLRDMKLHNQKIINIEDLFNSKFET